MKKLLILPLFILLVRCTSRDASSEQEQLHNAKEVGLLTEKTGIQNGDLIFQTSLSGQSRAIQLATESKYSHCGIIYKEGSEFYVFEAVEF